MSEHEKDRERREYYRRTAAISLVSLLKTGAYTVEIDLVAIRMLFDVYLISFDNFSGKSNDSSTCELVGG